MLKTKVSELYERQVDTVVASWRAYARYSAGAFVRAVEGASICVFPAEPERGIYNNALLPRGMGAQRCASAVEAMESIYRTASIDRFAAWAHESEAALIEELTGRGYGLDTSTRAMAMPLERLAVPRPRMALVELDWGGYLRLFRLPSGLLAGADAAEFRLRAARLDGETAGVILAFDHAGDCGIYNLETLAWARGRGVGTALTALQLHEARERGCSTASIQSTEMAEGVYASLGFLDLGRYLEYVPQGPPVHSQRAGFGASQ
jgi:GNAT superfamily N-acetyltransferase